MKKNKCFNLVFSISASVYKPLNSSLLKEKDILTIYLHGKTKLCIEEILKDLYSSDKKIGIANKIL